MNFILNLSQTMVKRLFSNSKITLMNVSLLFLAGILFKVYALDNISYQKSNPPLILTDSLQIEEGKPKGSLVGKIATQGQSPVTKFELLAGVFEKTLNPYNNDSYEDTDYDATKVFKVDSLSGEVSVNDPKYLIQVAGPITLTVEIEDEAGEKTQKDIVIDILDQEVRIERFINLEWLPGAPHPIGHDEAMGEVVDGKLYIFNGFRKNVRPSGPTDEAYVYDPQSNTWTRLANTPPFQPNTAAGGSSHAGVATDGTDLYIAAGFAAANSGSGQIFGSKYIYKYIVAENRYERLPDFPIERAAGILEYVNGKLYYVGGTNFPRTEDQGDVYILDLNNLEAGWIKGSPMPNPRHHTGSVVYKNQIYVFGGQWEHDDELIAQDDVHKYDPVTDTWNLVSDMPLPFNHIHGSTYAYGDYIFTTGGQIGHRQGGYRNVYAYQPETNKWIEFTGLPEARFGGVGALIDGKIYYSGGNQSEKTFMASLPAEFLEQDDLPERSLAFVQDSIEIYSFPGQKANARLFNLKVNNQVKANEIRLSSPVNWLKVPTDVYVNEVPTDFVVLTGSLSPGTYSSYITASDIAPSGLKDSLKVILHIEQQPEWLYSFNFQPDSVTTPEGFTKEAGVGFGNQILKSKIINYGWVEPNSLRPTDVSQQTFYSNAPGLTLQKTGIHLTNNANLPLADWVIEIPNGAYYVNIGAGDLDNSNSYHFILANDEYIVGYNEFSGDSLGVVEGAGKVMVRDGKLRIRHDAEWGLNSKINYIRIAPLDESEFKPEITALFNGSSTQKEVYLGQVAIRLFASSLNQENLRNISYRLNSQSSFTTYGQVIKLKEIGKYTLEVKAIDNARRQSIKKFAFEIRDSSGAFVYIDNVNDNYNELYSPARNFPANNVLTFHRMKEKDVHRVHDQNILRIWNSTELDYGTDTLIIYDISISTNDYFLNKEGLFPIIIPPFGQTETPYVDIPITFIKNSGPKGVYSADLFIYTNADNQEIVQAKLYGALMDGPEQGREVTTQQVLDAFGFGVNLDMTGRTLNSLETYLNGDEIHVAQFKVADTSKTVKAIQLAALHGCCNDHVRTTFENLGSFVHEGEWGQALLPRAARGQVAEIENQIAAFEVKANPSAPISVNIAGYTSPYFREPIPGRHRGIIITKARDKQGNILPHEFIIIQDYVRPETGCTQGSANCDFNDNLVWVKNLMPIIEPSLAERVPDTTIQELKSFVYNGSTHFNEGYRGNEFIYSLTQSNNEPSPNWASVNATTGEISIVAPINAPDSLELKLTAKDISLIELSHVFKVYIKDTLIVSAEDIVINNDPGLCQGTIDPTADLATLITDDNEGAVITMNPEGPYSTGDVITITADWKGKKGSDNFKVTVKDIEGPSVQCPEDIISYSGTANEKVINYQLKANDNCDSSLSYTLIEGLASGAEFPADTTIKVVHEVRDASGNKTLCEFRVTVRKGDEEILGLKEIENFIAAYPIPLEDNKVTLRFSASVYGPMQCVLTNLTGQRVYENTIRLQGEKQILLDFEKKLPEGLYFLELQNKQFKKAIIKIAK